MKYIKINAYYSMPEIESIEWNLHTYILVDISISTFNIFPVSEQPSLSPSPH